MIHGERTLRHLLRPIDQILAEPGVTEIVVNQPGEIGIEQNGSWHWRQDDAITFDRMDAIGILAGQMMGKDFDPESPICLATLPAGQRYTTCRPPIMAQGKISATIRVPSRSTRSIEDDSFDELTKAVNEPNAGHVVRNQKLIDIYRQRDWRSFFRLAVKSRKTILATGMTGSGKTTFLKSLLQEIPLHERLVTIEDTDEFGVLPQKNRVSLFYGMAGVTAEDLVTTALRMRPDRIPMQELRGSEAFAYLRALLAGHPGGLTTLHADKGEEEAFDALAIMIKTHPAGQRIPDDKLRSLIRRLIDVVVWCSRDDERGFEIPFVWFRDAEEETQ